MGVVKASVQLFGLRELLENLEEFPKATQRNVLRRALMAGGEVIEHEAELRAPVRTGTLRSSHTTGTKLSRRQRAVHKRWMGQVPAERTPQGWRSAPLKAVYVFVGPASLPQAIVQEFGAADQAPQPFMRPAWDGKKIIALATVIDVLEREIEAATQRLARKAAREAAKLRK
ncbi:MAG TPA: HK97 gp10 family phage protein [Beijerinckiaceae bacterium]|nr:HK97 gp10 family phage protein [Beijerinckiaceae bacterium]